MEDNGPSMTGFFIGVAVFLVLLIAIPTAILVAMGGPH